MGEILSYLPTPGLDKTVTIEKEGEGDDEKHGQVGGFLGFLFVCLKAHQLIIKLALQGSLSSDFDFLPGSSILRSHY